MVKVAVIQLRTPARLEAARAQLEPLLARAAKAGAELVVTPEGTNILQRDRDRFAEEALFEDDEDALNWYGAQAHRHGFHLLIGSALLRRRSGKAANRSHLFGPDGKLLATYDKIHLFDVNLGAGQETRESQAYEPGDTAVVVDAAFGKLGLTICYDVRFPHLFRDLAKAGAQIIAVPAAFTAPTGKAHWHVLLRARAIETGAFILAAAQGGNHEDGRATFGHSMIVAPWGEIIAELDHDNPGILLAELDLDRVIAARTKIPCLTHDRSYQAP
ncbi:hydrolase [Candidatus Phycosocius bacilliformis]|uniref:Hydrolase n=1 Tax=Candidatus Phycosocius bacilliformis TaxID=1445552 RepID=A0A2P2ECS0_9PROT|nr:carbon-nitrogen hydrolase family protein [Candidatus Phycosocius bacilliformis]GBF58868.1 hydrolase [Candidatus Phycosocius bacilliformis]